MNFSFPLSAALVPYALILLYVLIFALLHLQHLFSYGTSIGTAKAAAWVWLVGTLAIIGATFYLLRDADWSHKVSIDAPSYSSDTTANYGTDDFQPGNLGL